MNLSNLDVKKAGFNITVKELLKEIEKDTIFYDQSGGGVTFTGGEPLVQKDFLKAILTDCKNKNIHTAVDTSGYAKWDYFLEIIELVDLFLFDLKIFDETEHFKYTNVSSLPIRENLKKIIKLNKNIILRIPLIPDITDSEINLTQLREFIYAVNHIRQIHLLPYNRFGEEKYRKLKISYKFGTKRSQSDKQLRAIKKKFESYGFEVRIGG